VIRCALERKLLIVSEHWVRYGFYQEEPHISGGINATKDFQDDGIKKPSPRALASTPDVFRSIN
jgi:hypothetical protein